MHFYVDESGHTGANLFDSFQPLLYYGVLSSRLNIDFLATPWVSRMRARLGVKRLHAAELGGGRLLLIVDDLLSFQRKTGFRFDFYRVVKRDHAIICFFDQVFDQGMNPAMSWTGYWTPMKYVLLLKVASLFDEALAKTAWEARLEINPVRAEASLVAVCRALRSRVGTLPDLRSRQLISDTLKWAEANPAAISYNVKRKEDALQVMPNLVGFQMVMHGIADRVRKQGGTASRIVVDQQSQFNRAQQTLADFYVAARGVEMTLGPGLPVPDYRNMPTIPISFSSSHDSAGLELVDIHLWIFKRLMEKSNIPPKMLSLVRPHWRRGRTDEISLKATEARWMPFFDALPEITEAGAERAKQIFDHDETRRLRAVTSILPSSSTEDSQ